MTLALLLTIAGGIQAAGQEELKDSTSKDAIELYSDTTATTQPATADDDEDCQDDTMVHNPSPLINQWINRLDSNDIAGMLFVLANIFTIFVLAPVFIIIALFYFLHKNRKEKMRLAQMALQQGQPIPNKLLDEGPADIDDEYQKGMRQCFVGVGLMIFLGYAAGQVGFGIGALVFCIGLGKVFASKTARRKPDSKELYKDEANNNNNL